MNILVSLPKKIYIYFSKCLVCRREDAEIHQKKEKMQKTTGACGSS